MERTPAHYMSLIEHRIVRPWWWRTRLLEELRGLTDEEFQKLFPFPQSMEQWTAEFHSRARLRFFFHPRNQKDFFFHQLTQTQSQEQILEEADDVLANRFQTLGSDKVELGTPIPWQRDFKSGKEWPMLPSQDLDLLDLSNPSDVKVPWELSRFHQVWWLGKAYWLTHNEQYAEKFHELTKDWNTHNPVGKGVNWSIGMEAAIRACNWIAGYYFFCGSKSLPDKFWTKFLKRLYFHGVFICNNLEYSRRNGNHYLSNIVGLIALGIFFSDTKAGKEWLEWGIRSLPEQMEEQVCRDGVDFEKSTSYHRLVLELFYTATILCRLNRIQFGQEFMNRLEKMFDYVQYYTRPDGSIPFVGDADDGRLFRLSMNENVNNHRHALCVGAILFGRSDFKQAAGTFSQDALWLFGGEGFEKYQLLRGEPQTLVSKGFPEGGFYVSRNARAHLFMDAGDIGMKGRGGHGHNDTLSFELWAEGEPVIVDSGTYAYTFDPKARQEFRGTRAHNAVMVDGKELAEFAGLWSINEDATNPRVLNWTTANATDILEAEQYAYSPLVHRRRFEFSKEELSLRITDTITGTGEHLVERFLHFGPHVRVELQDRRIVMLTGSAHSYLITVSDGELEILDTWFSRSYGIREPNKTLRGRLKRQLPAELTILIEHV